ncbi:MAG: penicillin-binding protein activator LpoB [Putridiphycobacter sp.]
MKKLIFNILLVGGFITLTPSCHTVKRVDTDSTIDVSGKWNDVDSRLTAEEMTTDFLDGQWLKTYMSKNAGKKPVMIVGFVTNKSHEHIEAETFMKDLEQAIVKSNKTRLVQGGEKREAIRAERADQQNNASVSTMKKWGLEIGADFMIQGEINTIVDAYKRKKVVYYQVNLELSNIETNEIVWIGDKKIKKLVKN